MRYLPHTNEDIQSMLNVIGKPNIDALFASVPAIGKLKRPLNIPKAATEIELKSELIKKAGHAPNVSFLGAGVTPHFVPEMVSQQLLRSEWYTAYTPYQPEASQGTLQAIFEFQTMVAGLFGCEIANASMYDGSTALAEALLMACRLKPQGNTVVLSKAIHPEYRAVCHTYLEAAGINILELDFSDGEWQKLWIPGQARNDSNCQELSQAWNDKDNICAVAYQTPNFFGQLEDQQSIIDATKKLGAISIACTTEPLAFALIKPPGELGADIVVGEGIGFCGATHLGAPGVGLFATSNNYLRQMPGRLCGETTDKNGNRGFVLTLSTREKHIRRERATSNICTNHGLMALAFSITLAIYGRSGFIDLAKHNISKTISFRKQAARAGLKIVFDGPFFNESVIRFDSEDILNQKLFELQKQDLFAGVKLSIWYPELKGHLLISTTELHSDNDIAALVDCLA